MKTKFAFGLLALFFWSALLQAQIFKFGNGLDHNHYSIDTYDNDIIMAGTVLPDNSLSGTDIHVQRVDQNGVTQWEIFHDIGSEERCMGVTVDGNYIVLTGTTVHNGRNHIFAMQLDPNSGALINYVILTPNETDFPDQIGRDIIYSNITGEYYIAGWGSTDLNNHGSRTGILLALDGGLNPIWSREIDGRQLSTVTELPGFGLFTTGVNVSTAFDYSGAVAWQLNSNIHGTGAVYDQANDRIFVLSETAVTQINNATSSPSIGLANAYGYAGPIGPWQLILFSEITINPITNQLAVLCFLEEEWYNGFNAYPVMLMLDQNSLAVQHASYVYTYNDFWLTHDHGHFEAMAVMTNTNTLISYDDGFSYVNYESASQTTGGQTYRVNLTFTDPQGFLDLDCHQDLAVKAYPLNPHFSTASIYWKSYSTVNPSSDAFVEPHDVNDDCFPFLACGVTVNSITINQKLNCNTAQFKVNVSASTGTTISQYHWDWDDGTTTTTTTTPYATHTFTTTSSPCFNNVCVTVSGTSAGGGSCSDQLCLPVTTPFMTMYNGFFCPTCDFGEPGKNNNEGQLAGEESPRFEMYPNPADGMVNLTFQGALTNGTVNIYSLQGKLVRSVALNQNRSMQIDVSDMTAGTYILRVTSDHYSENKTLTIQ